MIVGFTQLVHKDDHVLMLSYLLHHEAADFFITYGHGMYLLEFGQDFQQLSFILDQRVNVGLDSTCLHLSVSWRRII